MSTRTNNAGWLKILSAVIVLLAVSVSIEAEELRSSSTEHFPTGGRDRQGESTKTTDQYKALVSDGQRSKPSMKAESRTAATDAVAQSRAGFDFWFYDADVILFSDDDNDGHFFGIDLLFDADTIWGAADVYAAVYLSYEGGPWNEYAVTEDFTIFGASGDDDYVLVTELMSGYPTGSYDLLIELFDAYTGEFLASFGPEETSELSFLPLEDFDRDAPVVIEVPVAVSSGSRGGGAAGLPMLVTLLAIAAVRRRSVRRDG